VRLTALAEDGQRHIADFDAADGPALEGAVMGVAVERERGLVLVQRALETAAAQKGEDRLGLTLDRIRSG